MRLWQISDNFCIQKSRCDNPPINDHKTSPAKRHVNISEADTNNATNATNDNAPSSQSEVGMKTMKKNRIIMMTPTPLIK